VTFHALDDFFVGWIRVRSQETNGAKDHSRCAVSTLHSIVIHESLLDGVQFVVIGQTLDRRDVGSVYGAHPRSAGPHHLIVDQNRT